MTPKLRKVKDHRYTHSQPQPGTDLYEMGKGQAALNLERYHYLRASILQAYTFQDNIPPDTSRDQLFPRQGLDFSQYEAFALDPIVGVKLHPREDGTINPEDLKIYLDTYKDDWKISEGGILYFIGDSRSFFNIVLNYHSRARTTGSKEWDTLFEKLKREGFAKSEIPCMVNEFLTSTSYCLTDVFFLFFFLFFAREAGCLDGSCPFQHDEVATRAARERILAARRDYMLKPTPKQRMALNKKLGDAYRTQHGLQQDAYLSDEVLAELYKPRARQFCSNPACALPWLIEDSKENPPLKLCSKCKWTAYCSVDCQKADWQRHKKEPCAPLEDIVKEDDLWSPIGTRKGTEMLNIDWGE